MTKEGNKGFRNSPKFWICDIYYVHNDVKVRDHCHITGTIEILHKEIVISILN